MVNHIIMIISIIINNHGSQDGSPLLKG